MYYFCSPVQGDVNLDLATNVVDIVNLVNMIFDDLFELLSECIQNVVDINADNALNVVDIVQLVNLILGIEAQNTDYSID